MVRSALVVCISLILVLPAESEQICTNGEAAIAELFVTAACDDCLKARLFLQRRGIPFAEYDADDLSVMERLRTRSGSIETPTIRICKEWIIGFDDDDVRMLINAIAVRSACF